MPNVLKAINSFLVGEYGEGSEIEKLPEDGIINLAYTEWNFGDIENHEIQVDFDLNNLRYLNYIDGELVLAEELDSLEQFIADLDVCDFDSIIQACVDIGYEIFEN